MSGQLILLDDDGNETDNFKPLNNLLRIGSDVKADVVLSGLKSLAFEITIDGFGRVSITNFMKKLRVNEKRMAKNVSRPLINDSMVQIQNYKFCWKYNPKLTKSYSMSPCSKPNQNVDKPFTGERRKTVCVNRNQFEDEGAIADKEPEAFIEDDNEENTTITSTVNKPTDDSVSSPSRTPFKPIVKSQALSDPVMDDAKASDEYGTAMQNIIDSELQSTSKRRTSLLLPVRENRATELRRASIRKSMSLIEHPISFKSFTPKKPNTSVAMVKGINAIVRVGLDGDDAISNKSPIKNRDVLDTTSLQKLIKTPSKSFPQIIDKMDMFNVVTDEMKKVGPSAYVSSVRKLGAVNSPRRTPKKCFSTPKRQSLHSELVEMGIWPIPVEEPISKDGEEDIVPSANLPSDEMEERLQVFSDESDDDDEPEPVECLSSSSDESVICVEDDSACETLSSEDEANNANDTSENILVIGSTESTPSSGPFIQTINDSERGSQISSDQVGGKEDTEDELDDSVFASGNETFVKLLAEDTSLKLGIQRSEQFSDKLLFSTDTETAEMIKIPVNDDQPEHETVILGDKSSKNSEVNNDTEAVAVSTPLTRRPSLIRTRRNSRLCSLDECCNPNTLYGSPRKTKSEKKTQASPRSILKTPNLSKTPNPSKTPKKNVRILEPILHEEDDEETKTSAKNVSQAPTSLNETFEIDEDDSTIESSFVVAEMKLSHSHKTPEKHQSTLLFDDQPNSSVLNKEIISTGVQDTNSNSNCGEDNGQKSVRQINSSEPSNEMIDSEIEKELRLNASVEHKEVTADIEHEVTKSHFSSVNDEGDQSVEPVKLPKPGNEDILSEVEQEIQDQLKVSSDEIEGDTFETRLSSPEPNDQETCQDVIIPSEKSEHREPQSDCSSSNIDIKEQFISPEPNKKIVSDGEENREKSVEPTNSPKSSKEISSWHCNDDGMDVKKQSAQQPNLSEISNEIILSENEKEPQLDASIGFEVPNSSETNENIECQHNQSYSIISDKDNEREFEESIDSSGILHLEITQEPQLDEGELEELDEEESANLPELSKEAILLKVKQQIFEQQLTETCRQIIITSDGEPQSDSNTSVNGTDEEHPILTEPNKEVISTDVKESHPHSIDGGKDDKKQSDERSNQPEPSTEIIFSEIMHDPPLGASVKLDEQLNLSEKNEDIDNNGKKSCCSSGKGAETEFEEQIHSSDQSKEDHLSELKQRSQLSVNSGGIEGETFEKRLTSPEPVDEEDLNSIETCQQIITSSKTKGDGEPQSDANTSVNSTDEEHHISTEPNKVIVSTDVEEIHPNYNDGGKDEKKPSEERSNQREQSAEIILSEIKHDPPLGTSVELEVQLNLSEKNRDIENSGNKSCCRSDKDAETEFEEQIPSPDHSKEVHLSEIEQGPQLCVNSGGIEGETFEKRLTSQEPNDEEEDVNSMETCQQIIIPSETKGDGEPQLDSNTSVNGADVEEETISPEPIKILISPGVEESYSHSNSYEENGEISVERTNSSEPSKEISSLVIEETQLLCNDGDKEETSQPEERSLESSNEIIISEIEQKSQLNRLLGLVERPKSSEPKKDIEYQNQSYSNRNKIDEEQFAKPINLPVLSNESVPSEKSQETQSKVDICEREESNEHNSSTMSRNDAHIPSLDEPTHSGQLKLDFEFKSRKTLLNKINSALGTYGFGSIEWSEKNAVDTSKDDTKPNVVSRINETDDTALVIVPTQDVTESLTFVTNDSEKAIAIQSQCDLESAASNNETTTTKNLKQPKSIQIEPSESYANNIDESSKVPSRSGRKIESKIPEDLKSSKKEVPKPKITLDDESVEKKSSTDESVIVSKIPDMLHPTRQGRTNKAKSDSTTLKLGTAEKISRSTVNKTKVQRDREQKASESEEPDTYVPHIASEIPVTSENDVRAPTRGRNNKNKSKTDEDSQNVEVAAVGKVKANVQGSRTRKTTAIKDSEAIQSDTDDDVNISTRVPINKAKPTFGDDSKNVEVGAVGKVSRAGRTRKTTAIKDSEANQSDNDDDVPIPTQGHINKPKSKTGVVSKMVEAGAVGKVSIATVEKANVQTSRTRKTTAIEDSEGNQSDTDDVVKLAAVERESRTPAKKTVQRGRKRKITATKDSEANQSDADVDVTIPTQGRINKAKSKTDVDSKNVEVGAVGKVSRATVKKANVKAGRTRKTTAIEDSEANQSDTDDDVTIPTQGRNNKAKSKTDVESKNVEVGAGGKVSRATVNKANVQAGHTRKTTAIKDSEANQSDTDDVVNIPTRGRNNKPKSNAAVEDIKVAAGAAAKKMVQKGRKKNITATEDSEANQSYSDDVVNISTQGRNKKAKSKTDDDSKQLKLAAFKKDSSAGAEKVVEKGGKRKVTTIEASEAVHSDTDETQATSEVSAPNNNEKRITTRGRNNKAKADDDSKTVELGAIENVRKGRSRQATVAKNLEAPASTTDESQLVSETPATSEDDKNIQKRKGGKNKADARGASKVDAVESVSEIPTLKKATRGLKRKVNANDNMEPTTLVEDTHESRKSSKVRKLGTSFNDNDKSITKKSENSSETSSSTKVNQVNAPSSSQQSTTDGLKNINAKPKPESSNATSQPSKAVTRNRRKLAEDNSEADSEAPSSKASQMSKPVTRKRRKMTEVNSEIDVDEALQVPNEQTNTRPKRGVK